MISIDVLYFKYNKVDMDISQKTGAFNLDAYESYGISFLIVITASVVAMGLRILGSGIADESIRVLSLILLYSALWAVLSILSIDLLFENKVIGLVIYTFLCIIYLIGVGQTIGIGG